MNARSLTVTASTQPRVLLAALAVLALVCATGLVGSAPALAAECLNEKGESNEALRSEARSTQLAQCRAYELVSPVDTADGGVQFFLGAAPDGEAAAFISTGGFAGAQSSFGVNEYIARRVEKAGWQTSSVDYPATFGGPPSGALISFDLTKRLVLFFDLTGAAPDTCGMLLSGDLPAAPALSYVELADYPGRGEELLTGSCEPTQDQT